MYALHSKLLINQQHRLAKGAANNKFLVSGELVCQQTRRKDGGYLDPAEGESTDQDAYMGTYYDRKGHLEQAKFHFESITTTENFSKNWYTTEASNWLDQYQKNQTVQ